MDEVFVLPYFYGTSPSDDPALEWALNTFDRNKTKIILTYVYPLYAADASSQSFIMNLFNNAFQNTYLPRCQTAQFQVDIVRPTSTETTDAILELHKKHGMKKLVAHTFFMSYVPQAAYDTTFSCKIWFLQVPSKVDTIWKFGPELHNVDLRVEELTEQTKINEQKIGQLTQENEQLKKNAVLSTSIKFDELEQATEKFKDSLKIGEGGSGSVYKGIFRGTVVAVKTFKSRNKEALYKFQEEVVILVTLIGTCSEPPVLVYEFLENGSLHNRLTESGTLNWKVRTRIISEICLALIFLHSNKPTPIIHGDLKPDNIFLDANLTSKLSDFGIIKQEYTSTNNVFDQPIDPERTHAYKDPRYFRTGKLTLESDVYSFGVIILRLVTGKTPFDIREEVEKDIRNNEFHTNESDRSWPPDHAKKMAEIGIRCAQDSWTERPHLVKEVWPIINDLLKLPEEAI